MDWLDGLNKESVEKICREIYINDRRTSKNLLSSLWGSKFDYEGDIIIDVGDAKQKIKDRGYL
ncbi:hypothetical protein ACUXFS_001104 [Staphylococcus cohnii]